MADKKRKLTATHIIFGIYFLILVWLVLFKLTFNFSDIQMLGGDRSVNFIPFYYDSDVGRFHLKEVIMNVLVFVPFGMYLKMLGASVGKSILIGFLCSLFFEIIQFIFAIGSTDVTDLITNTLGTVLGICVYVLSLLIFRKKSLADKVINTVAAVLLSLFLLLAILLFTAN
ncbi:MAG: VanZ family protein [Clostridia bacterium]|nr:VanZ family protein [Clostridia bacterium]